MALANIQTFAMLSLAEVRAKQPHGPAGAWCKVGGMGLNDTGPMVLFFRQRDLPKSAAGRQLIRALRLKFGDVVVSKPVAAPSRLPLLVQLVLGAPVPKTPTIDELRAAVAVAAEGMGRAVTMLEAVADKADKMEVAARNDHMCHQAQRDAMEAQAQRDLVAACTEEAVDVAVAALATELDKHNGDSMRLLGAVGRRALEAESARLDCARASRLRGKLADLASDDASSLAGVCIVCQEGVFDDESVACNGGHLVCCDCLAMGVQSNGSELCVAGVGTPACRAAYPDLLASVDKFGGLAPQLASKVAEMRAASAALAASDAGLLDRVRLLASGVRCPTEGCSYMHGGSVDASSCSAIACPLCKADLCGLCFCPAINSGGAHTMVQTCPLNPSTSLFFSDSEQATAFKIRLTMQLVDFLSSLKIGRAAELLNAAAPELGIHDVCADDVMALLTESGLEDTLRRMPFRLRQPFRLAALGKMQHPPHTKQGLLDVMNWLTRAGEGAPLYGVVLMPDGRDAVATLKDLRAKVQALQPHNNRVAEALDMLHSALRSIEPEWEGRRGVALNYNAALWGIPPPWASVMPNIVEAVARVELAFV